MLCATVLLAACATPSDGDKTAAQPPTRVADRDANRPGRTPENLAPTLSPAQALASGTQGARVRWSGGINAIDAQEGGRQCFTLLHATFDALGVLQWPGDAQQFIACGAGPYDRALVSQFSLVTFDGRVAGQQVLAGKPVPVIEIDALFRHSDCVQGSEKIPECYAGYLQPLKH
jgi:hypothetical protein